MAAVDSIRDFHSQLAVVCESLEAIFLLASSEHEAVVSAVHPSMVLFQQLLDAADLIADPDPTS